MNEQKGILDSLILGEISSVIFHRLAGQTEVKKDDDRILFAEAYLSSKGIFFELNEVNSKYGKGYELKLIDDYDEIDALQEDYHMHVLFEGLDKNHRRLLRSMKNITNPCTNPFYLFMTQDFFDSICFYLILDVVGHKYDLEALRDQSLLKISVK
jgi:hypothetical protein